MAAIGGLVLGVSTAQAHSETANYSPQEGVPTGPVEEVCVFFAQPILPTRAVLALIGPGFPATADAPQGQIHEAEVSSTGGKMCVPLDVTDPGNYEVTWQAISTDGHPQSGDWTFTVSSPEETESANSAAESAGVGNDGSPESASQGASGWVGWFLAGTAALGLGVSIWGTRRRRAELIDEL